MRPRAQNPEGSKMKSMVFISWQNGERPKIGTVFGWDGYQYLHVDGGSHQTHFRRPLDLTDEFAGPPGRHADR